MPAAPPSCLTRRQLMDRVWRAPLGQIAAELGMTANGLAKLCDRLAIPRPARTYWHRPYADRAALRPELPPAPPDAGETIQLRIPRQSRRTRTRLNPDERREQLLDAASVIATAEGVQDISLNRVARAVGISEAQAHNCFGRRIDLLVALARRELAAIEQTRRDVISRGDDPVAVAGPAARAGDQADIARGTRGAAAPGARARAGVDAGALWHVRGGGRRRQCDIVRHRAAWRIAAGGRPDRP